MNRFQKNRFQNQIIGFKKTFNLASSWLQVDAHLCAFMCVYVRLLCAYMCVFYVRLCGFMCVYVRLCGFMCVYVGLCAFMCAELHAPSSCPHEMANNKCVTILPHNLGNVDRNLRIASQFEDFVTV